MRQPDDLCEAGIFDLKHTHRGEGPAEENTEQHTDNAAMAEDGHLLARMLGQDTLQAGLYSFAQCLSTIRICDPAAGQLLEPGKGTDPKFLLDLVPTQSSPVPEIYLAQVRENGRFWGAVD